MGRLDLVCLAVLTLLTNGIVAANSASKTTLEFDYVVIGGGTAGLVVAERLSEDISVTVAVIEAGTHHVNEPLVDTPGFFGRAIGNPAFDWNYITTPQASLHNASLSQPRGKMLGGSSGLNGMVWDRASQKEYDAWEQLGATGWNWDSLLPYFKRSETMAPPSKSQVDPFPGTSLPSEVEFDAFHGRSGPIQASYSVMYSNVTAPYVNAINNLGIQTNSNPDAGNATGIYNLEMSVDRVMDVGKRSYSASAYYNISARRPNFHVFLNTEATKINFDSGNHARATNVDVVAVNSTGTTGRIFARREVIISAGVFGTPHILELSGIGNPEILSEAGIETLIDLPAVGENLQDHAGFFQDFEVQNTLFTWDVLRNNATFNALQEAEYAANGTGLLADIPEALTFSPLKTLASPQLLASMEDVATMLINSPETSPLARRQYTIQREWLTADDVASLEAIMYPASNVPMPPPRTPGSEYITIYTALMHPFGRGSVHVNTSNPLAYPLIDPRYLDNDIDRQFALLNAKLPRRIVNTEPLNALVVGYHLPPANLTTDDDWEEYVKLNYASWYHSIGTAAMLPRELGGVVDPLTLKVYGTDNLRVVDASLMPMLIAAHLQRTVYAIAERASDIIKGRIPAHGSAVHGFPETMA